MNTRKGKILTYIWITPKEECEFENILCSQTISQEDMRSLAEMLIKIHRRGDLK